MIEEKKKQWAQLLGTRRLVSFQFKDREYPPVGVVVQLPDGRKVVLSATIGSLNLKPYQA